MGNQTKTSQLFPVQAGEGKGFVFSSFQPRSIKWGPQRMCHVYIFVFSNHFVFFW